jgi:tRNA-modifying protein YgfZ
VATTALTDRLRLLGAQFAERDGFTVATVVSSVAEECDAVRRRVGVADRGARGFFLIEGRDAERFLQGLVTNDAAGLRVGDAVYTLVLTPKARIIADMRLTRLAGDRFVADCEPQAQQALGSVLVRYRLASKVTIDAAHDQYGMLLVAGADAGMLLVDAFGVLPAVDVAEGSGTLISIDGHECYALRSSLSGETAFELLGPRPAITAAWDALVGRLAKYDGRVIGADAVETLRIEAGVPRFGAELDDSLMPAEAGVVERAVSFTKGCYVGQEPVARLHYRGHANRGLRALLIDGPAPARATPVVVDGREVGRVTSAAQSPTLGRAVALAIVRREVDPGQVVRVGETDGELVAVPAYRYMRPG